MPSKRRVWLRRISLGSLAAAVGGLTWGFGIEPGLLTVQRAELRLPGLQAAHDGLSIAILTDLHVGAPHIDLEQLDAVVDATLNEKPDLVVVLGDLVIHGVKGGTFVAPEPIAAGLSRLRAPMGVVAVLGNHDWWYDGMATIAALRGAGLVVLDNASIRVGEGERALWLAGLGDLWTNGADIAGTLAGVTDDAPIVVLSHNPDVFPNVPARVSLTLAGHTHGGQVRIPLVGPPIVPSDHGMRYAAGHVVEDGRHMWVATGVGTSIIPVRFLVRPAIDVLVLRAA